MTTATSRLVAGSLLRIHRPIVLWFWGGLLLCVVVIDVVTAIVTTTDVPGGLWMLIANSASRYWMLVIGILLVVLHLRAFVANGVTRRDFTVGSAVFGIVGSVVFGVVLPLGHAVESLVLAAAGADPASYQAASVTRMVGETGRTVPALLAFLVSGLLIGAGYYRFNPLVGTLLILPSAVPGLLATWMLSVDDLGQLGDAPLPYAAGAAVTLTSVAVAYLAVRRILGDVAIRRTAG